MTGGTGRLRPSHHPDDCVSATKTPSPEEQPNNYTQVGDVSHQHSFVAYPGGTPQCVGAIVGPHLLDLMQPPAA